MSIKQVDRTAEFDVELRSGIVYQNRLHDKPMRMPPTILDIVGFEKERVVINIEAVKKKRITKCENKFEKKHDKNILFEYEQHM